MKRENFEKAIKLLDELYEVNDSLYEILHIEDNGFHSLPLKSCGGGREKKLYSNEATTNVLKRHYKLEKARIEKELEEL